MSFQTVLTDEQYDLILAEIVTGNRLFRYDGENYAAKPPSTAIKSSASAIYADSLVKYMEAGVMVEEALKANLKKNGMWPSYAEARANKLRSEIEALEKTLSMTGSSIQEKELSIAIDAKRNAMWTEQCKLDNLLEISAEGRASQDRDDYYVSKCVFCGESLNNPVWASYENFLECDDDEFVNECRMAVNGVTIGLPARTLRAVARSEAWRRVWKTAQKTGAPLFDGPIAGWDSNKTDLCHWSDFYDSIFGYHKPPPDTIINDDQKLFEWIREVNRLNASKTKADDAKRSADKAARKVGQPYKVRTIGGKV